MSQMAKSKKVTIRDGKRALKQRNKRSLFRLIMDTAEFEFSNAELGKFFMNNGRNLSDNFVDVFPVGKKKEFWDEIIGKETKCPIMTANTESARKAGIQW